ncbi:MAG: AI-2E family transporter [Balneolaceae bacterium]|nr:MAG: AI-2E family transporter [Balneolaceae bacterium]
MVNRKKGDKVTASVIAQYTLVVIGVLITTAFLFFIRDALLMAFGGIIFAVIINGFARIIRRFIPISRGWSLAAVGVIFLIVITSFGFLFGSQIVEQFDQLTEKLPQQISQLRETISEWPLGDELMGNSQGENAESDVQSENGGAVEQDEPNDEENGSENDLPDDAGGMAFKAGITIIDVLATFGLILIIGIYFVIDPETYRKGIGLFFTKKRAKRITEALDTSGNALWSWLSGQFIVMAFVGVVVTIGLMIIGVPLALLLGIIAGLSEFIPILGPWIGAVPGILLALSVDAQTALYTAILYVVIQQVESNILTPLIQQKMVHIPPAVVILSIVAFGLLFGIAGIILATPLAVIAMVLVGMFYVEDVLGKEIKIPGRDED